MIGITNSININPKLNIYEYNKLLVWFDGTDFINHASTGSLVTATNKNNFNTLQTLTLNNIDIPFYYKSASSSNGIDITATSVNLNLKNITVTVWCYRFYESNNYSNIFSIGNSSDPLVEFRSRHTTNNQGFIYAGRGAITQSFTWTNNTLGFVACSVNNNTVTLYFNGQRIYTGTFTNDFTSYTICRILGATVQGDAGGPNYVTDLRIYDTVLSDSQILEMYNIMPQQHKR